MDSVYFYLFWAVLLHIIGIVVLGHFDEKTPLKKRLTKVAVMVIGTALAYTVIGRIGALIFSLGLMSIGLTVHIIWCRSHEIHLLTAEPKARYYELRGWS
jgi:hypothetical protein